MSKHSNTIYQRKKHFIAKALELHGHRYDYSKVEYVNNSTKVKIICKTHGEFLQRPHSHVTSLYGCHTCGLNKYTNINLDKPGILYYLVINFNGTLYYKIGMSGKTVRSRYSCRIDYNRIVYWYEWPYTKMRDCHAEENRIKNNFAEFLYTGKERPLYRLGVSEIFKEDISKMDGFKF